MKDQPSHHGPTIKKHLLVPLSILLFLIIGTVGVVIYGKGYRLTFQQGEPHVAKTGILHTTSMPTGAQVYINGHLTTATNNSTNLVPGKYTITISKDGYTSWQKDFQIQAEVVSTADALLFRTGPSLQSISTFGIENVVIDPSETKLAFRIASQSARKNGIYVLDMTSRTIPVLAGQSSSTQLVDDTIDRFSEAALTWSPDGKQMIAKISDESGSSTYYLLKTDGFNNAPQDITPTLTSVTTLWQTQRTEKENARIKSLKPNVAKFAAQHFKIIAWSPDETKILYQASKSADMPVFLKPRRIGNNHLYERRDLEENAIYVYNITEDMNTRVVDTIDEMCIFTDPACNPPFRWFPDSTHLLYVHDKKINIVEDDGANMTTLYAGPFVDHYAYPWPDGSRIVILTNLNNTSVPPTLYTISLK